MNAREGTVMTSTLNLYATEPEAWASAAVVARQLGLAPGSVKPAASKRPSLRAERERAWLGRCLAEAPALSDPLREELAELMAREH